MPFSEEEHEQSLKNETR